MVTGELERSELQEIDVLTPTLERKGCQLKGNTGLLDDFSQILNILNQRKAFDLFGQDNQNLLS